VIFRVRRIAALSAGNAHVTTSSGQKKYCFLTMLTIGNGERNRQGQNHESTRSKEAAFLHRAHHS
jgi:hypothetical protein